LKAKAVDRPGGGITVPLHTPDLSRIVVGDTDVHHAPRLFRFELWWRHVPYTFPSTAFRRTAVVNIKHASGLKVSYDCRLE
jgi:hypothetical protein